MEQIPLLAESLAIFALSIGVILICYRFSLPSVVGFLVTGILCGPHGLGLIREAEDVQIFANIGIILLLFLVGMEVSVKQILSLRRFFLLGGALQVIMALFIGWIFSVAVGRAAGEGLFWGCLLALSSTAIVLRSLAQQGELDTPHGRAILAILIFQDFCAVPMMLMVPFLCGASVIHFDWNLVFSALKGVALIVTAFSAASFLVPKLLYYVAKTRIRELFLLTIICICLSVAWASAQAGLSLALGAFLAGLIISQSDFSHEAIGNIVPFQDLFTSVFFVSIGMLLDIHFVLQNPVTILSFGLAVLVCKTIAILLAALLVGVPLRTASLIGLSLAQISEFSFVLAKEGVQHGLMPSYEYQLFLAVALLTMAMTPWVLARAHSLAALIHRLPIPERYKLGLTSPGSQQESSLDQHVVIVGFGHAGRSLAHSCKVSSIPYVILEMNAQTVRQELLSGEPIYYGDASHESVLEHVKIAQAKAVAIVINDAIAATRIIKQVKHINPSLYLVVRTRYVQDAPLLYSLGADDVIPDEHGSAVEVFARVLRTCAIPKEQIEKLISASATKGYELLRSV